MRHAHPPFLFREHDVYGTFENVALKAEDEISKLDRRYLIDTPQEDLARVFEDNYIPDPLVLNFDQITYEEGQVEIDISKDPLRSWHGYGPHYISVPQLTFLIPYQGQKELFDFGSGYISPLPQGYVSNGILRVPVVGWNGTIDQAAKEFERQKQILQQNVTALNQKLAEASSRLKSRIFSAIVAYKQRAEIELKQLSVIPYPKHGTGNAAIPVSIKRKVRAMPLPPSLSHSIEEFFLPIEEYHAIISSIVNMGTTIERSPSTYAQMGEEQLRDVLLIPLNEAYEGLARGEVFNHTGKTDILIPYKDKNLFIAECKFFEGTKSVANAIDQLCRYITWRDTKTALIVFSRRKNFSDAISVVKQTIVEHSLFSNQHQVLGESSVHYRFRHPNDSKRHFDLTLIAFNIPVLE